jgi:hypothetical protein
MAQSSNKSDLMVDTFGEYVEAMLRDAKSGTYRSPVRNPIICDMCGAEVSIGDWPWCPHGRRPTYNFSVEGGTPKSYAK